MAETTNHSVFKLPPPRLALITPSASPPISRTLTPHRSRSSSIRPPPSKRPRLSATPSSSSSLSRLTPSLSSSISTDQSLRDARRVSQLNILNFWDSLADRYNVPTDEDDIYDIEKDVLYKDRGYLRRAKKTFSFGCFRAGGADEDASSDNGGAQTEGEDVFDDVDEIDAFAPEPEADISGELEKSVRKLKQPIQEMNPADAEDLKQFLEAEKRRKELMGEEDEEDEGSSDILGSLAHGWGGEEEEEDEFSSFDEEIIPDGSSEPGPPESSSDGIVEPVMQCTETEPALTLDDEESEDEIATWVIDDTPILVNRTTPRAKSPSVVSKHEVIDLTTPSPPSSPPPLARSVSRTGDSPLPSVTPKRTSLAKSKTSAKKFGSVTSQEPVAIQLQTPPLSSPSHPPISDDPPDFRESLLPSSSPPPSSPTPRSASRPKPKPIFSGSRREASQYSDEPESLSRSSPVPNIDLLKISLSPKPSSKSRRVSTVPRSSSLRSKVAVEVVLPISSRRSLLGSPQVPSSVSPERNADSVRHGSQMKDIPTRNTVRKDKGKERDLGMGHIEWATQASNDRPPPSSPSSAPRKELTKRTSPQQSPASSNSRNSTQKRKRLASSSPSSSEDDEKNQPRMVPPSLPRVSTRNLAQLSTPKASGSPVKKQSSRTPHKDVDKSANENEASDRRGRSPSKARRSSIPPNNLITTMYPYGIPSIAGHEPSQTQYPPPPLIYPLQDPQAQYYFVQAVQHLSYLMSGSVPGFPPPFPQPNWPPITPKHHRRKKSTRKDSSSPPPGGPSSEPSSSRATPNVHRPLYPESYNPAYSSGSLPPSSPPPSSPSSPIWRPKSALRSGSKSRGRRVSFRLDPEELPEIEGDEEQEDEEVVVSDRELSPEIPLAVAYSHSSSKKVKKPPKSPVSSRRSVDEDGREDRDGEMPSSP